MKTKAILLAMAWAVVCAPAVRAQTAPERPLCGDSMEAADLANRLRNDFAGDGADATVRRAELGMDRVDPADVRAETADYNCLPVLITAHNHVQQTLSYPYRLIAAVRLGSYYAVAVRRDAPPPPGEIVDGRDLLLIMRMRPLFILRDDLLY